MSDVSSRAGSEQHSDSDAKGVWEAPTVEELDFSSTEIIANPGGGVDGGFYHS